MWVSQTYLTNLRADKAVAAYFLFEAYRDDHKQLESLLRPKLAQLALAVGDAAHVFVPAEEQRASIEKEFNGWIRRRGLQGIVLPGILVLDHGMSDERSQSGSATYISFSMLLTQPQCTDALLDRVKDAFTKVHDEMKKQDVGLEAALQNLQLRPGLWGIGYDFKPHLVGLLTRMRRRRDPKNS
jgi:hypothetical protein